MTGVVIRNVAIAIFHLIINFFGLLKGAEAVAMPSAYAGRHLTCFP